MRHIENSVSECRRASVAITESDVTDRGIFFEMSGHGSQRFSPLAPERSREKEVPAIVRAEAMTRRDGTYSIANLEESHARSQGRASVFADNVFSLYTVIPHTAWFMAVNCF